jgi:hypothetical protein
MEKQQSDYISFLLRLWRESDAEGAAPDDRESGWRASVQDSLTGERITFADLEDLVSFLRCQVSGASDAAKDEGGA